MTELKIEIPKEQRNESLLVITNRFDVGVKKDGNIIILNGNKGDIEDLKAILKAKIIDPSKIYSEWIYPLADPEHPHSCSPDCKMPDTKAGCSGCPLA